MFRSIRWRIAIPYIILITITMVFMGVYLTNLVYQSHLEALKSKLVAEARLVGDSLREVGFQDMETYEVDQLAKHWADLLEARVTIISPIGVILGESHTDRTLMDNHLNRPEVQQALKEGEGSNLRFSNTVQYEMLYSAVPIFENNQLAGFARVSLSVNQIMASQAQVRNTIILITLLMGVLAVFLASYIAASTTKPLRDLTQATQEFSIEDLSSHLPVTTRDEVGQLTEAFNTMIRQLHTQIVASQTERGKLTAVLEGMTDGVLIVNDGGEIELINPAAEELFNTSSDQAVNSSFVEVVRHHELITLWRDCMETRSEQATTLELPIQQRLIQCIALSLRESLPDKTLLLFQDLTRIRRLETIRRDFISNISHELRTPLASLKALTETLQSGALDDPPAARRFLNRMETEVDALTQMVSELLELTRIESGQVPLEFQSIAPVNLLNSAVDRLGMQAERANLKVYVDCPADLPRILADPPRLGQALVNLLHNAIKFTPSPGEIVLSARQDVDVVVISIEDTGVGIPADDLPRVFERFYKIDRSRAEGGTGLGLAITRHIVEAHGGKIWAESVVGQGSKFSFTIPIDIGS
jgi:two-component system phosphate regulon sensor histidine kinase PhoR